MSASKSKVRLKFPNINWHPDLRTPRFPRIGKVHKRIVVLLVYLSKQSEIRGNFWSHKSCSLQVTDRALHCAAHFHNRAAACCQHLRATLNSGTFSARCAELNAFVPTSTSIRLPRVPFTPAVTSKTKKQHVSKCPRRQGQQRTFLRARPLNLDWSLDDGA